MFLVALFKISKCYNVTFYTGLQNFTDETTQWHENRTYTVTGLNSSTPYTLTVVSRNEDGNSDPPQGSGTVQFTTAGEAYIPSK